MEMEVEMEVPIHVKESVATKLKVVATAMHCALTTVTAVLIT